MVIWLWIDTWTAFGSSMAREHLEIPVGAIRQKRVGSHDDTAVDITWHARLVILDYRAGVLSWQQLLERPGGSTRFGRLFVFRYTYTLRRITKSVALYRVVLYARVAVLSANVNHKYISV